MLKNIDMAKTKKNYSLLRQWKMLQLLPSKWPKDAATLRDELEDEGFSVDLRTVQRDLKELMEVFPVTAKKGKPISWRWDRNAMSFDVLGMDNAGALTMKMVGEFMTRLLPKSCLDSLKPSLRRAETILDEMSNTSYGTWPDKVRVVLRTQPLIPPDIDGNTLDVVYEALFKNRRFRAMYLKKGSETPIEYIVNPLGLIVTDPILYLVTTLWDYDDIILLAVQRFQSVELLHEPIQVPEGFCLDSYLKNGGLGFPVSDGEKIRLKVLFDKVAAAHLYESPLSMDQSISEESDGRVLVEADVLDTQQLRWWLLSFGQQVEVVSPESLRAEFALTVRNMSRHYNN